MRTICDGAANTFSTTCSFFCSTLQVPLIYGAAHFEWREFTPEAHGGGDLAAFTGEELLDGLRPAIIWLCLSVITLAGMTVCFCWSAFASL